MVKFMASAAIGGDLEEVDPGLAAAELRKAGYTVFLLSDQHEHGLPLCHPRDDFIEAYTHRTSPDDKTIDTMMSEVDSIVTKYGGCCVECGPIGADHVAFANLK